MSGREFFVNRYRELGWEFEAVELKQAIRVNSMNVGKLDLVERLEFIGISLEKIAFLEDGYWVCESKFSLGATSEYLLGLYSIQEAAAQIPVALFAPLEDKTVMDACAAPGGKTVQLADSMQNTGAIIALDIEKRRLHALSNHLERCHVKNTIVYCMDARQASRLGIRFDRILLDAPCSGNFAVDRAWFDRRTINDVRRNAQLQREMLTAASGLLRDYGELVYSTCSLEPEENELNVDWAVKRLNLEVEEINCLGEKGLTEAVGNRLDPSVERCRRIWPDKTQGFFVCKLKRRS